MATGLNLQQVVAVLDPEAPETLIHIMVTGTDTGTGDPTGFAYDYNTATADVPTLCEGALANAFTFPDGCT